MEMMTGGFQQCHRADHAYRMSITGALVLRKEDTSRRREERKSLNEYKGRVNSTQPDAESH